MKNYNCLCKAQDLTTFVILDLGRFATSIHLRLATLNQLLTFIGTLLFEWYVVKCGSKKEHQQDMCLIETERVHAHNLMFILGSPINIDWGDLDDHSIRKRMFTLIMNRIFI
jgi:hypothetical protein